MTENMTQMSGRQAAVDALQAAVIDIAVDPAALYSFCRDSIKHSGG